MARRDVNPCRTAQPVLTVPKVESGHGRGRRHQPVPRQHRQGRRWQERLRTLEPARHAIDRQHKQYDMINTNLQDSANPIVIPPVISIGGTSIDAYLAFAEDQSAFIPRGAYQYVTTTPGQLSVANAVDATRKSANRGADDLHQPRQGRRRHPGRSHRHGRRCRQGRRLRSHALGHGKVLTKPPAVWTARTFWFAWTNTLPPSVATPLLRLRPSVTKPRSSSTAMSSCLTP